MERIKLLAFDLDGTLTQHKTPLSAEHRQVLDELGRRYHLLMVGAGMCRRIYDQMGEYPIDIIGNYGMQTARYDAEKKDMVIEENHVIPCDRDSVERRVTMLRGKYGFTAFAGDSVEYHASGCVTFPILGTKAVQEDKLAFDPDRKKRRAIYEDVKNTFPDFTVFVGGSSSFDMAPAPFDKAYALKSYCEKHQIPLESTAYVGDDYGEGGNDEAVYKSGIRFIKIDDYRSFPERMREEGL